MIIASWDVGVIYLAYCVIEYLETDEGHQINILDWDTINLIEDDRISLSCCGKMKDKLLCGKNASFYITKHEGTSIGFCKTHVAQCDEYWSQKDTIKLFKKSEGHHCQIVNKKGNECGKKSGYRYDNQYLCNAHYKTELKKRIKDFSPQPIKNMIVKKFPTAQLQLNLIKRLDDLTERFTKLGVKQIIIENQPSQKNPKMKSIANTLFDYFMIRGYIDHKDNLNLDLVKFMCPSNKLKINNNNTIEVFKKNKQDNQKYKLTKTLGIQYTKQLLSNEPLLLDFLDLFKKKDDLCDAYLQGRYYLECILFKDVCLKAFPQSNSKTAKKKNKKKSSLN